MNIFYSILCILLTQIWDTSFRQVIVTGNLPAQFHYSKNSEIMKISMQYQHAKKVVSNSSGLVDFAIELVNFVS